HRRLRLQGLPDRQGHGRIAQDGGAYRGAVEVGAAGHQQVVLPAQLDVAATLGGRVLTVDALDAHETGRHQGRDDRVPVRQPRVGEDGHAAGPAQDPYRVLGGELLALDVPGLARREVLVEGLAHRLDVAP